MNAYSPEARDRISSEILSRLAKGEPLAQICRDDFLCDPSTFRNWCDADENLAIAYARAREDGFDVIAIDCLQIANTTHEGVETTVKPDGSIEERRGDMLGHRKLQIDTRLKLLAKWDPKRYGERITNEHTGKDGKDLAAPVIYQLPANGRD
jgi:hypothetical protein